MASKSGAINLCMNNPGYRIFEQIESPSKDTAAGYLSAIIEKIGEARFQKIVQKINQNSQ